MVSDMRIVFRSGRTRALEWRLGQLRALLKLMDENQDKLCDALYQDLHKVSVTATGRIVWAVVVCVCVCCGCCWCVCVFCVIPCVMPQFLYICLFWGVSRHSST